MDEKKRINYEMANADDPHSIIEAATKSVLNSMQMVLHDLEKITNGPGLTWLQLDAMIEVFKNKKPTVVFQDKEQ